MDEFPAYELVENGTAIRCGRCGRISHHRRDIEDHYCGFCHRFLDEKALGLRIYWFDGHREPACKPNPDFPNGIDIDATQKADSAFCESALPYPALRCGYFRIECDGCQLRVMVTTAGRTDDPRSIKLPCRLHGKTLH